VIVAVTGVLSAAGGDWVHLTVGGVTLQLYVPASDISALGDIGSQAHLFTHLRMRDDQPVLYGFSTPAALELFLVTQGVSGVGPRLGLALLSGLGAAGLQQAITEGDVATLSGISGVGRRIAGRIVLELKGKLELEPGDMAGIPAGGMDGEVIAALTALGYSTAEARRAIVNLDRSPELAVEDYIRQALLQIGGG
jgi:Holliday junction DNA helicase RuvA